MKQNNGFVILPSYYEAGKGLDDQTRLELWDTLIHYGMTGEMTESDNIVVKSLMIAFKPNIDSSIKRYNASVENGKKGGRPKKTQSEPNNNPTITQDTNQVKPNQNLNKNKDMDKNMKKDMNMDMDNNKNVDIVFGSIKEVRKKPSVETINNILNDKNSFIDKILENKGIN
jgi:hypothetical protein